MLAFLAFLFLLFWIIGLAAHWFGGLIYIALVVGIILAIAHFITRRPVSSV